MPDYKEVKVNVDTVLLTLKDDALHVALCPSAAAFLRGALALPGAIMDGEKDATLEDVVVRMLRDKAGLSDVYFEQLHSFSGKTNSSGKNRDVRWPSITVAYIALVPLSELEGRSAREHSVTLVPVDEMPDLPFDHNDIVDFAVERLRGKGAWSVMPAYLLDREFTMSEMNRVYNKVLGVEVNPQNFRRKVIENEMVEALGKRKGPAKAVEYFRIADGVTTINYRLAETGKVKKPGKAAEKRAASLSTGE